jgi:outer membrane lipoprotein-sorting protein
MKGLKRVLGLSVFAVVLACAASTDVSAQGVLSDILKRMDENNKGLKSLKSNIKMDKLNSQLGENDVSVGTVQYLPAPTKEKIRVRIDWTKPTVEHLSIGGGKYMLFRPRLQQAIVGNVDSAKGNSNAGGALAFMTMSRALLKTNYDVTYQGEATVGDSVRTWHLKLTPKNATSYRSAELWVDSNGMPVQAKVYEKNNDTTTIQLSKIERNATIPGDVFSIKPPKGTKIIQG